MLFEKATFLVMSYYTRMGAAESKPHTLVGADEVTLQDNDTDAMLMQGLSESMLPDARRRPNVQSDDRYERISEMVKHFKISCLDSHHQIQGLELRTQTFAAYLDVLTSSTYILVIVTDPAIRTCRYSPHRTQRRETQCGVKPRPL